MTRSFWPGWATCVCRAAKSTFSTSDSTTFSSGRLRSRAARSRSSSITVSRSLRATTGSVRAARPGPISTSACPGRGAMARTISSITPLSLRKCWPKRLRATWPPPPATARFGAPRRRCAGRSGRITHLDPSGGADLAGPFFVGRLELALAQHVAGGLALLCVGQLDLAAFDQLDQVHAETADHRIGDLSRLQGIERLLELGHEHAGRGPAEVAAARGAAVFRILTGHLREAGLAVGHLLADVGQLLPQLAGRLLRRGAQQDVTGALFGVAGLGDVLAGDELDHVEAGVGAHDGRHLADLQAVHGAHEEFGQAAGFAQTDGATLLARGAVVGLLLGQLAEVGALCDAGAQRFGLGLQRADLLGRRALGHRSEEHTSE